MGSGDDEDYGDDEAFIKHVVGAFLHNDCISCLQDGLTKVPVEAWAFHDPMDCR